MELSAADEERFQSLVNEANEAVFRGWDFSYMEQYGGNVEEPVPWSYVNSVRKHLRGKDFILDMGTGGGEFLAELKPLPVRAYATEAYRPNVPVAKATLEPLGVRVVEVTEEKQEAFPLPFAESYFEVIINRHEAYDSKEVFRILKPGGVFITQQVGQRNNENLRLIFGTVENTQNYFWELATCCAFLQNAGLTILEAGERIGYSRMVDIRSLVYLLKALPWEFPAFDPTHYMPQLRELYIKICEDGYIDATSHRFFVVALKPA